VEGPERGQGVKYSGGENDDTVNNAKNAPKRLYAEEVPNRKIQIVGRSNCLTKTMLLAKKQPKQEQCEEKRENRELMNGGETRVNFAWEGRGDNKKDWV